VWVRINTAAQQDGGRIIGWVGTAVDVTPVVEQSSLSDQLVGLLDVSGDAVVVFDRAGTITFANDAARTVLGVDPARPPGDDIAARTYMQAVRDQLPRHMLDPAGSGADNRWEGEIAFRSPDGLPRTLTVIVQVVRESDGTVHHWATIARDITEERQARAELDRLATHDALTGLPNRVLFLRKTTEALERAGTTGANVAVLFIDLDKLKHVNDTIGHAVGDQLIVSISRRLASATRPSDTVVLCEGVLDEHVALDVAERVRTAITGQVVLQGIEIETGASIGVALATDDLLSGRSAADAAVTLLHAADTAMYKAKQRGRGRSELYSEQMRAAARDRARLSAELEQALAGGQFELVYQPIELAHAGRVAAVETFLRWNHPVRGQLAPAVFLELADESGLIGPIGDWVLGQACRDLRGWIDAGLVDPATSLHINVSRRQLADITFVDRTVATLRDRGIDGSRLVCETGEATLVDSNPAILRTVNALKRAGVRIAVDDFGSGYSSLASLRTFPADILKIDGTLVRDVGRVDGGDDLSVCAEWVTSDDQLQRLRVLGCDLVQGNRIGAASPADELARRLSLRRSAGMQTDQTG
jgi:diguanylate cyclase (GGDEF)-like protein/PAS domain S-box-containing protein